MEKLQSKGELAEEELRALEEDVTGKVWRVVLSIVGIVKSSFRLCLHHGGGHDLRSHRFFGR